MSDETSFKGIYIDAWVEGHNDDGDYVFIRTNYKEPYNPEDVLGVYNKEDASRLIKVLEYFLRMT